MGYCTEGAGWWFGASELVVSEAEAVGALGASVEAEVWGDLEASSEEEEALQGIGGIGSSYYGEDHRGCLLPYPLFRFSEPAGGAVEGDAWVEGLNLVQHLGVSLNRGGDGGGDVVDDHLHYLDLFEESSSRWEEGADGLLKLLS